MKLNKILPYRTGNDHQQTIHLMQRFFCVKFVSFSLLLGLTACKSLPSATAENTAPTEPVATAVTEQSEPKATTETPAVDSSTTTQAEPARPLTSAFIYRFLLAEISGQRGDYAQSSQIFYQLAQSEQDARFAERAAKIAAFGRVSNLVYPSVRLWASLDPDSHEAQQAISEILVKSNKLAEAEPHLAKLLTKDKTRAAGFILMGKLLNQSPDKQGVLTLVQNLATPYPALAESHIAIAQSAINANNYSLALKHLAQADSLRPGWNFPALLKSQILFKQSVPDAIAFNESFLSSYPNSNEVRLNFARSLVQHNRYEQAKLQFPTIIDQAKATFDRTENLEELPESAQESAQKAAEKNLSDTLAVIGLLAFQGEDYMAANSYFQQALDFNFHDPDQIHLYFGQVAEKTNKFKIARYWYDRIKSGQHFLAAQLNIANLIQQTDTTDQAIEFLNGTDHLTVDEQVIVIQSQANMLHNDKRHKDAFLLLKKSLADKPNAIPLKYDYALAAERLKKYKVMEENLRLVIQAKPDFAPAYNALGYSFADRNINLDEALTLIQKALRISPNDHYMLDSLGWVYFRKGDLENAVIHLQRAYDMQADPEIAAHLGEALWQQGKHDAARKIWQDSLQKHPDNETLISTTNKYNA